LPAKGIANKNKGNLPAKGVVFNNLDEMEHYRLSLAVFVTKGLLFLQI